MQRMPCPAVGGRILTMKSTRAWQSVHVARRKSQGSWSSDSPKIRTQFSQTTCPQRTMYCGVCVKHVKHDWLLYIPPHSFWNFASTARCTEEADWPSTSCAKNDSKFARTNSESTLGSSSPCKRPSLKAFCPTVRQAALYNLRNTSAGSKTEKVSWEVDH